MISASTERFAIRQRKGVIIQLLINENASFFRLVMKLRSGKTLDDYMGEIPPTFGSCLLFKVTTTAGMVTNRLRETRKVLQLNYVRDEASLNRHLLRHSVAAKLKSLREHFMKAAG